MKVKLPEALLGQLEALAGRCYATAGEFIRRIVTDYVTAIERTGIADATGASAANAESLPLITSTERGSARKNTSGYKGVYANGRRWFACVVSDKQRKILGTFDNPEDAARAYDNELIVRAGGDPCAAVNFPGPDSKLVEAAQPFIEKFVAGTLTDEDRKAWQAVQSAFEPPRDALETSVPKPKSEPKPKPEPRAADEAEPDVREPEAPAAEPVEKDVLPMQVVPNDGAPQPLVAYAPRLRKSEK